MIKRHTIQCDLVLDAVNKLKCHATADEVHEELIKEHPSISRGTVYRNLQRLCDAGEIRKCEIPGCADRFDHNRDKHYHIVCVNCGRVSDVDMDYMDELEESIGDSRGFTLLTHDIVFRGVCPECKCSREH